MDAAYDLTGRVFGKLTVRSAATRKRYWRTECECGGSSEVRADHLIGGKIRSCGRCVGSTHPLFGTWTHMIDRCTNPKAHNYRWYGATGVTVCARWLGSFKAFAEDVGERPEGMTLDRFPDKSGNYEPGNVRWATKLEQGNNARNNLLFEVDGVTKTLKQWSREYGVKYLAIHKEVSRGRSLVEAVAIAKDVAASGKRKTRSNSKEKEICDMLVSGASTKEIVLALNASPPNISRCRKILGMTRNQIITAHGHSSQQAKSHAVDAHTDPLLPQESLHEFCIKYSKDPDDDVR